MATVTYNFNNLLQRQSDPEHNNKTTWTEILTDMSYILPDTDFHKFKITATYTDPITQEAVNSSIFIYLHNCSFVPEEHHILHPNSDHTSYVEACETAENQSREDNKIHFVPDYRD